MKQSFVDFELIWKKYHASLTEEERNALGIEMENNPFLRAYDRKAGVYYSTGVTHDESTIDKRAAWQKTKPLLQRHGSKRFNARLRNAIAIAASLLILVSAYFVLFQNHFTHDDFTERNGVSIAPGTSRAKLILHDGQSLDLVKGADFETLIDGARVIAKQNRIEYALDIESGLEAVKYNTLVVPRGAEYFVILSDSTRIWLNSDSQLKYPTLFSTDERAVWLEGEAYFEVAHMVEKPFKVFSGTQTLEVLGTAFNISAYADEELIFSTLAEGAVRGFDANEKEPIFELFPGDQAVYSRQEGFVSKQKVDVFQFTAWKDGVYSFDNKPLGEMMQTLARWYNVNVVYADETKADIRFTGEIYRYENLEKILHVIEKTDEVKFRTDGKTITVY